MRAGTLRLVRALRLTFGHDVDDAADFAELLRGVAAVDHMWRSDTDFDAAGPFMLDLLNRVVAAHRRRRPGWTGRPCAACWPRRRTTGPPGRVTNWSASWRCRRSRPPPSGCGTATWRTRQSPPWTCPARTRWARPNGPGCSGRGSRPRRP
ncbi:hypothetical protein ACFQV4_30535 [Streptomyces thermocarboxydus]